MSFYQCSQYVSFRVQVFGNTYAITDFNIRLLLNSLHQTALLIRNIPYPICLPRRNQYVRTPALYMPIKLIILLNFEPFRPLHHTGRAVMIAIVPIHGRIYFREKLIDSWNFSRRCCARNGLPGSI